MNYIAKKLLFFILLVSSSFCITMNKPFDKFLCYAHQTQNLDDSEYNLFVPRPLFMALFVQASKSSHVQSDNITALVQKIKNNQIDLSAGRLTLTKKDFFHRLLLHIPWNGMTLESLPEQYPVLLQGSVCNLMLGHQFWQPTSIRSDSITLEMEAQLTAEFVLASFPSIFN
jgi:hypothetical protein